MFHNYKSYAKKIMIFLFNLQINMIVNKTHVIYFINN